MTDTRADELEMAEVKLDELEHIGGGYAAIACGGCICAA